MCAWNNHVPDLGFPQWLDSSGLILRRSHFLLPAMRKALRIAPAPANAPGHGATHDSSGHRAMEYTCQTCTKRKVKCDKLFPACSRCRKAKLECYYQPPRPRQKRKLTQETSELQQKIERYERILRENGLLNAEVSRTAFAELPHLAPAERERDEPTRGTLLGDRDASRYIESHLWRSLGEEEMHRLSDDAGTPSSQVELRNSDNGLETAPDAFTDSILDPKPLQLNLLQCHPSPEKVMTLWQSYLNNVDPLCRVLHIPMATKIVELAREHLELVANVDECLLFAIYHFSAFSLTEVDCTEKLGETRTTLLQRYQAAARRAFVNASFLKTTSITVLQALVLFLMPCRHIYEPHTYWILTGIAVRIGQRIGIHRDGEALGLPPFQTEMRRRLFYHLLPLDSSAAQISGVGVSIMPGTWDTKLPLNISDDQIWPGMTESPVEEAGPTDMMFCLSRFSIGKYLLRLGGPADLESSANFSNMNEAELSVGKAEAEVEEKYIRYCDILNPLHVLTVSLSRAGLQAMRLKIRLPKIRNQTATDGEVREAFHLAGKIMDTDTAIHGQMDVVKKYRWHLRPFFVWGTWDSFILILTTLRKKSDLFTIGQRRAAWERVESLYSNHGDLLDSNTSLNAGFRRLTLKAWDAQSSDGSRADPEFIKTLRSAEPGNRAQRPVDELHPAGHEGTLIDGRELDTALGGAAADIWDQFCLDGVDWGAWDQFIQDDACV